MFLSSLEALFRFNLSYVLLCIDVFRHILPKSGANSKTSKNELRGIACQLTLCIIVKDGADSELWFHAKLYVIVHNNYCNKSSLPYINSFIMHSKNENIESFPDISFLDVANLLIIRLQKFCSKCMPLDRENARKLR